MRSAVLTSLVVVILVAQSGTAYGQWGLSSAGAAASRAETMPSGNPPTTSVSGRNVTVSWTQSNFTDAGAQVNGYLVRRYDSGGQAQTVLSGCSGTISVLACTEQAVPAGDWKYSVTPKQGNWSGSESAKSSTVTVGSPTLTFSSSTTVTSLPTTLSGAVTNFITGQTLVFRLDDPSTGATLSGSLAPNPVPNNGGGSITVTIPSGTANGPHTVYAVGSQGDVASAGITVDVPIARTLTMPAWSLSDASSGTAKDTSDPFAYAGGPYHTAVGFQPAFASNRYLAFDFHNPLRSGFSTSSVAFNFSFAASDLSLNSASSCFYFDVRRKSTGTVLATHGSTSNPVGCSSGLSFMATSTPIPEVTTTDIANDLQIRVYLKNAASGYNFTDLATVSGSQGSSAFTLYDKQYINAASGTAVTTPWSLATGGDSSIYIADAGWDNAFNSAKYLKLTFPSYVPSGASAVSGTFKHTYKSDTSGTTSCYYFEVYSGTTLIGTHGSSSSPVSCNSTSSYVTDTVAINEVNSASRANSLIIRIYAKNDNTQNANKRKTDHDLSTVTINYTG
jgi:hypothetical protein